MVNMKGARKKGESNTFRAIVAKVQTLVDGGIRITLDLSETEIESAAWLMNCKRVQKSLIIVAEIDATLPTDPTDELLRMQALP